MELLLPPLKIQKHRTTMATAADPSQISSETAVWDEFRAGVTACLRSWSALRTAVESGWGGIHSVAKADELRQWIIQEFFGVVDSQQQQQNRPKNLQQIDLQELEDELAIYMEEEFSITLEDRSEIQVADALYRLFEAAHRGDVSLARQIVTQGNLAASSATTQPVQVQSMEHDDDDDDDDDDPMAEASNDDVAPKLVAIAAAEPLHSSMSAAEYSAQSLFGTTTTLNASSVPAIAVRQLGEAAPEPEAPMMDDDGFAPVVTRKKKGR